MIDGYKYKDGKIIVYDYDKTDTVSEIERKYQDNIEELLMAENIKEYLYDYKDEVNKLIDDNKSERTACIQCLAVIDVALFIIGLFVRGLFSFVIPTVAIIGSYACGGLIFSSIIYAIKYVKQINKTLDGAYKTLDGIKEEIENNKVKLRRLKNDDRCEKEDIKGRNYVQLNYVQELKRLREYLELWRVLGENEKKFSKYNEQDKMYTKLDDKFRCEEITMLKRILDKKRY